MKCEWCGRTGKGWPETHVRIKPGLADPFEKFDRPDGGSAAGAKDGTGAVDRRFCACQDTCRDAAARYYEDYARRIRTWYAVQAFPLAIAFGIGALGRFNLFRWTMPAALLLCGMTLAAFPYVNRFSRDKSGNLKTSLKLSNLNGRLTGLVLMAISIFFLWRATQTPDLFF